MRNIPGQGKVHHFIYIEMKTQAGKTLLFLNKVYFSENSKNERNRWEDNIKEWTGMEFGDSLKAAEGRE